MVTDVIIKKGYKQTKIGVIPEDWGVKQLKEVVSKVIDNRDKTPPYSDNANIELIETASISFVNQYPDYSSVTKFVSKYTFDHWFREHPLKVDVLISTVGEYSGASAIMKHTRGTIAQNLVALRIKEIDPMYVFYWTRSTNFRKQLSQVMMNQAQPSLRVPWLLNFYLNIPKPKEQTAIATVLSDTDALIEHLEKLIAKKKAIKQGTMQQLLTGKKRLPGFSGEWEVKKLGEIGKFKGGSGFPIKYQGKVGSKYPFYKVSDMNNDGNQKFMRNSNNWIDESTKKIIGANIFPEHTIVFAKIGAAIYLERKKILFMESCIDNNMMAFIFDEFQSDYRFLHYLFLSIQLGKLVSATALPSLNGKQIAELSFAFPRKEEQTAIAAILSDMDAEIESLEQKKDKYTMLKQGMMQQLLTGRIRIYDNN